MDLVGARAPSCKTKTDFQKVKVFTYYVPIKGKPQDDEIALIEVWKKSWALRGWNPVVLGEEHVPDDPEARKLKRAFKKQPTRFAMKSRGCMPRYSCIESLRSFA